MKPAPAISDAAALRRAVRQAGNRTTWFRVALMTGSLATMILSGALVSHDHRGAVLRCAVALSWLPVGIWAARCFRERRRRELRSMAAVCSFAKALDALRPLRAGCDDTARLAEDLSRDLNLPTEPVPAAPPAGRGPELAPAALEKPHPSP